MWFVLFSILMDVVGFGIIVPILPFYVQSLGAGPEIVTLCLALYTASMFFSTAIWGRLSDRYGRKPIMLLGLLGATASCVMLALADSIWMIALSRIFGGLMAGNISAAYAYITDSTSDEDRGRYMGYAGACFGLGFIIGPAIGSWMGGESFENANFVGPALAAAGLTSIAWLGIALFVKESRPAEVRGRAGEGAANKPPGLLAAIAALRHRSTLVKILVCGGLYQMGGGFYESIFPLWAADLFLIDGPSGMLPMLVAGGAGYVFVQAFLMGPLTKRFDERALLRAGALGLLTWTTLSTVAGSQGSVPAVTVCFALSAASAAVILTSAQTLVSRAAGEHERGVVMGVFSAVGTLTRTASTALSGVVFSQVHTHGPYWAAGLLAALLFAVASTIVPETRVRPSGAQPGGN